MLLLMVMIPFHLSEMVLNTLFLKILKMVMVNISMLSHYLQQRVVRRQCQNHYIYLRCHFLLSLPAIQAFHRAANFCFCIHAAGSFFAINRSKLSQDYHRSELARFFEVSRLNMFFLSLSDHMARQEVAQLFSGHLQHL